jgi:hypothetical protein
MKFKQISYLPQESPTDMWQVMSDTVWQYRPLLSDIYGHFTSMIWTVLTQNLLAPAISLIVHLTPKIKLIQTQHTKLQQIK